MAYFTHRPKGPRQLMHVVDPPPQLYKKKNTMTAVQKNKTAVKLVVESGKKINDCNSFDSSDTLMSKSKINIKQFCKAKIMARFFQFLPSTHGDYCNK